MTSQQGAPDALRPIQRFEVVDCIDSKHVPAVIPKPHGPWVRYEDHVAALVEAQQPAPSAARPVTPYTCPKCHALWLHWPAEQTGFGRDTLNCRSADHCHYCEKAGVEQLQRLERVPAVLSAPQPSPTPQADSAQAEPLQAFDSPRAKALMRAWEEGWAACRDSEYVGEEAQNDAFNSSHTLTLCIAEDQQLPAPQADSQPAHQWDIGYPPLPEPDIRRGGFPNLFREDQMRAYVDADRAARAPADSVTGPAGGAVAEPRWKSEDFEVTHYLPTPTTGLCVGMPKGVKVTHKPTGLFAVSEDERSQHRNREVAWNKLHEILAAAPTPPAQAADSVLEDAARLLESQHTWITNVAAANLVRSLAARKQGANHD